VIAPSGFSIGERVRVVPTRDLSTVILLEDATKWGFNFDVGNVMTWHTAVYERVMRFHVC